MPRRMTERVAGATVCKPAKPECSKCPLKPFCAAYKGSKQLAGLPVTAYPGKAAAVTKKVTSAVACVIAITVTGSKGKAGSPHVLLVKRPAKGLLAGMWEVPTAELPAESNPTSKPSKQFLRKSASSTLVALLSDAALQSVMSEAAGAARRCEAFVHQFTHITLTSHVLRCDVAFDPEQLQALKHAGSGKAPIKVVRWADAADEGISTLTAKVLQAAGKHVITAYTA